MPMSIEVGESYRLPPYSTVIGFVHNACGFDSYHPMQVSIQGTYHTIISDMYTRYFMGISFDPSRHQFKVSNAKGGFDGITKGLGFNELLTEIKLVIHIKPREEDFDAVLNGLKNPRIYPALGRYEDIMRIDKVRVVELEPAEQFILEYDTYVPEYVTKEFEEKELKKNCTRYTLNKAYMVDEKRMCRVWEKVRVYHYPKDSVLILDKTVAFKEKGTDTGVFFA